jgi:hypothetical protein
MVRSSFSEIGSDVLLCRAKACAYTTGFPGNHQKKFATIEQARLYMLEKECVNYTEDVGASVTPRIFNTKYYAVGSGRQNGVYPSYQYVTLVTTTSHMD